MTPTNFRIPTDAQARAVLRLFLQRLPNPPLKPPTLNAWGHYWAMRERKGATR